MGRSQRHMIIEQGANAAAAVHDQGAVAPGIALQVDPARLNVAIVGTSAPPYIATQDPAGPGEGVEVPIGEPGGPLSGSSLTGAIPESLEPPPEPPEPVAPVLTSLDPDTAVKDSPDFTLRCLGSGFTESSVIMFAGQPEPIVFVSPSEITTGVKPSLGWGTDVGIPVSVKTGDLESATLDFTFTPAEPTEEGSTPVERIYPLGPALIGMVADHADGLEIGLIDALDVRVGDQVTIEATGTTAVNGNYTVLAINPLVVDNNFILEAPIENKGRLTVTAGA